MWGLLAQMNGTCDSGHAAIGAVASRPGFAADVEDRFPTMKMWIQVQDRNEDDEYPDDAAYEILTGGVLKIVSGNDIHLYSPAYWQEVTIDTRSAEQRDRHAQQLDEDLRWQ
ncbi:hypothetical protein [Mycobacterium shimoidei]|nr:hypothetical protein [Mycobacterium shimoidei]